MGSISVHRPKSQSCTYHEKEQENVQISLEVETKAGKRYEKEQNTSILKDERLETHVRQVVISSIPAENPITVKHSEH